ncbi:hypothetical protein ABZZ17_05475 [Streptomyces sp. NPDC006512]|uniref:hypothetical protein n=1 Tax=Streptomyces sp. NPDC006512 TaxID=3154307 RepID=UPI00339FE546
MKLHPVDGSEPQGLRIAAEVMLEMPADMPLPGPWRTHATDGQLLDGSGAHWFLEPDGTGVRRIVWFPCACAHYEATWYCGGIEVSRIIHCLP